MKNRPECIPCCLRRVLHGAMQVTDDEWLHRKILADAMQELARADEEATPAELIYSLAKRNAKALGVHTPYAEEKAEWLRETTGNEALLRRKLEESGDPFLAALKFSLVANLLDCELRDDFARGFSLKTIIEEADRLELPTDTVEDLRDALGRAATILFVHDTAGELFFDRLLIEQFQRSREQVTSVLRESPVLAHATVDDALAVGLDQVARLTHPGIGCLGLPLSECSTAFREEYRAADLVLAKGQAAYETLEGEAAVIDGEEKELFFLLRVKCPVVARALGVAVGDCVIEAN